MSVPRIVSVLLAAGLALAGLAGAGCSRAPEGGGPPEDNPLVVTQVPATTPLPYELDRLAPLDRYPLGSRIVLVEPALGGASVQPLSAGLAAAGAPAVAPDAETIVFAGLRAEGSNWAIYEATPRRTPRLLVDTGTDCLDPAFLAAGKLVFSCASGDGETPAAARTWSLYTADPRGGSASLQRITFGPGSAFDPTPLQDGRVLFSLGRRRSGGTLPGDAALFTVNPDGTLLEPYHDAHRPGAWYRARQADGAVVSLLAGTEQPKVQLARLGAEDPEGRTPETVSLHTEASALSPGASGAGPVAVRATAAEPLAGGGLLVAGYAGPAGAPGTAAIYRREPGARLLRVAFDSEAWHEVEAVALAPRPAPRGQPSRVDLDSGTGTLLCLDARRSDGVLGPPPDAPAAVRVVVEALVATGSLPGLAPGAPAAADTALASLGSAPVEADGSFYLEIPADLAVRLRTFAAGDRPIAASGWFWVRPGENRMCFGCHEPRTTAPVNRPILAISREPSRLDGAQ